MTEMIVPCQLPLFYMAGKMMINCQISSPMILPQPPSLALHSKKFYLWKAAFLARAKSWTFWFWPLKVTCCFKEITVLGENPSSLSRRRNVQGEPGESCYTDNKETKNFWSHIKMTLNQLLNFYTEEMDQFESYKYVHK